MEPVGAIIFLPREGNGPSLMLEDLLFDPAALWLAWTLREQGVARFFVVCHADDRERAVPCFPEGTEFVTTDTEGAVTKLSAFLDELEGPVAVVTRPVVLLPAGQMALRMHNPPRETGLFTLEASALAAALEEGTELEAALRAHGVQTPEGRAIPFAAGLEERASLENVVKGISTSRLAAEGVRIIDPFNTYVGPRVKVGAGTVLLPGSILRGDTVIGSGCEIGPNSMITSCKIGDRVTVNASQLLESTVEEGAKIGPFAYVRPHCRVGREVKVGDFVELKNSSIGSGTKISHLTYVGDSDVGSGVNFGCGTVTVNYDGTAKFRTTIGDRAFIGCNTNLVAPVRVGEGAYTAAGSTITDDVPADSLAIARSIQVNKKQWAAKRRRRR